MYGKIHRALRRAVSARAASSRLLLAAAAAAMLGAGSGSYGALVSLPGHVHRFAQPRFDLGEAPNSLRLSGLDLVFARTPAQEQALQQLLSEQRDPGSPHYHQWLTPDEFGRRFGASEATIAAVSNWLKSNGLQVGTAPPARGHLPFFGSKAAVESALQTQVHLFDLPGGRHYANVSNPLVPAIFKPLIAAIRGLNDFHPRPGVRAAHAAGRAVLPTVAGAKRGAAAPDTYYSGPDQWPGYVGPTDFAIMYDVQPVYQQGITGAGVTVAIAAQSDIESSVLTAFWSGFGVSGTSFGVAAQQFSSIAVPVADGGHDPGETDNGDEDEAYLDTEIVGALAPGATLLLVRDKDAGNAAQYIIDENLGAILNISFSTCESDESSNNSFINSLYEQAASQGITITVSSDDAGVAGCTAEADLFTQGDVNSNGFAVNALASTPYDLAVGGTDFDPNSESQYWNTTNQAGTLASAASHIPEIVWNDSCANPVFATYYLGTDPITFCNTAELQSTSGNVANPFIEIAGGGGGLSSCTTMSNGACAGGYPQPSWQAGVYGIGNFGARALPDVSLIATRWLMCSYDTTPCDPNQAPTFSSTSPGTIEVLDGTSAAAPAMAAIIALVDQTQISSSLTDGRQGVVNPVLYSLAAQEYGAAGVSACDASQGAISSACVFYDVTSGSSAQPCSVAHYSASASGSAPASTCASDGGDATGVMQIAGVQSYAAASGFDLASGLGSINVAALVSNFQAASAPSGLAVSVSGNSATLTWTADGNATLGYDIYQGSGTVSSSPIQQNVSGTSATVTGLQFGQSYVFAIAAVSSSGVSARSAPVGATIVPAAPTGVTVSASSAGSLTLAWTASGGASSYNLFEGTSSGAEGTTPAVSGVSGTSSTITGLSSGQQYFFTVVALDAGGASAPSAQANGTVVPAAPTGLSATAGNGSVSLTWSAATGASSYEVFQGSTSGGEGTTAVKTGVSGTTATLSGLSNGTKYYFTVAAVDAGGASAQSSEANATPVAPKGGGGSMDWLALGLLAGLLSFRRTPSSRPRAVPRRCR
ncbi:MAG TPA: fibronectin type III domain-containing protein [Steroidobacteraceae bacterium]|nr:fibronectin type III domain-containing protein [Steroidobacteraceae bacterium]